MSGLLALLDDVAAIAKVAATSVDDIAAAAAKAGAKTAGVVIDDAAVTPKYVQGFAPARELPIIWRIARGSVINKLVILAPMLLALDRFAPWVITPLLMLGGAYLCFEGAEKVWHALFPHAEALIAADMDVADPATLEEAKIKGAIKTDFILSAEIMTITLAAIEVPSLWMQAATLALVGLLVTVAVYGAVALIVKMDDLGLHMALRARSELGRATGRGLVAGMPKLLALLSTVGTAAMLWVGGNIVIHGMHEMGQDWPYAPIKALAARAAATLDPALAGSSQWVVTAGLDGVFGLALGLVLIPVATRVIAPLVAGLTGKPAH